MPRVDPSHAFGSLQGTTTVSSVAFKNDLIAGLIPEVSATYLQYVVGGWFIGNGGVCSFGELWLRLCLMMVNTNPMGVGIGIR